MLLPRLVNCANSYFYFELNKFGPTETGQTPRQIRHSWISQLFLNSVVLALWMWLNCNIPSELTGKEHPKVAFSNCAKLQEQPTKRDSALKNLDVCSVKS